MDLLWLLLIGLVAGWLAGVVMRGRGFGILGNLAVGVLGSLVGGFLFRTHWALGLRAAGAAADGVCGRDGAAGHHELGLPEVKATEEECGSS
jgi:uncharacterized membrane protein YeaQ/YmgE (transglycosylase-associated protein family)